MQIGCGIAPFPLGDHDVASDPLRTWWRREWEFARGDVVRPFAEQFERLLRAQAGDVTRHERRCAAGLQPFRPGVRRVFERTKPLTDGPGARSAQGVTGLAGTALHDVQPLALALDVLHREFVFPG